MTPMTDLKTPSLVERLRSRAWEHRYHRQYREEAAAEIERLTSELATLTQRLEGVERERDELAMKPVPNSIVIGVLQDRLAEAGMRVHFAETRAESAQTLVTSLSEALRELVRLKKLKDEATDENGVWLSTGHEIHYRCHQPLAWEAARKLVALPDEKET